MEEQKNKEQKEEKEEEKNRENKNKKKNFEILSENRNTPLKYIMTGGLSGAIQFCYWFFGIPYSEGEKLIKEIDSVEEKLGIKKGLPIKLRK